MSWVEHWRHALREGRHNPCLMRPVTALVLVVLMLFWLVVALLRIPTLLLSFLLAGVLQRFPLVIEFLYPTSLGRWIHITVAEYLMGTHRKKLRPGDKNRGFHSRCLEQRLEVVPDRVYVHPLPQYLDNLGYLVVCLPPPSSTMTKDTTPHGTVISVTTERDGNDPTATEGEVVAFLVDCGQYTSVLEQLDLIRETHYPNQPFTVQAILSTHKHHDHTGGNLPFLSDPTYGPYVQRVVGGAVENVPGCNHPVAHGDRVPLPRSGSNDMNAIVEVQIICTPAHTRGSVTYALRPLAASTNASPSSRVLSSAGAAAAVLFTGDTVFCGGSGVPFEADVATADTEATLTPTGLVRATAGTLAVERCFAEILAQCCPAATDASSTGEFSIVSRAPRVPTDRVVLLPGHEYTTELLARQMVQSSEACKWKNYAPRFFFETASHLFVATHRRSLPHSSGKLISAATTLRRELLVNPQLRMLRKRGEHVLRAVQHWHRHFAQVKVPYSGTAAASDDDAVNHSTTSNGHTTFSTEEESPHGSVSSTPHLPKQLSLSDRRWNLQAADLDRPVFCTVYAADLQAIASDLRSGRLDPEMAAQQLTQIQQVLDLPTIGRRPVPDTLPSDRSVVRALVGLCLLGSAPAALTLSDSLRLKLPPPVVGWSSDRIAISKARLLKVLRMLGLLHGSQFRRVAAMLDQLWKEAREYSDNLTSFDPSGASSSGSSIPAAATVAYEAVDVEVEVRTASDDQVELGALRWVVFGVPRAAPFLSKLRRCLPCSVPVPAPELAADKLHQSHLVHTCGLSQHAGELVRHDLQSCLLCVAMTGCHVVRPDSDDLQDWEDQTLLGASVSSSSNVLSPTPKTATTTGGRRPVFSPLLSSTSDVDEGFSTEVPPQLLNELLREA